MTNADTEAPDEEGAQIDLIQHCCKRLQARWLKHIRRVRSKGWGDHICIAALANLFCVTINTYTATKHGCAINTVMPFQGTIIVVAGLIST